MTPFLRQFPCGGPPCRDAIGYTICQDHLDKRRKLPGKKGVAVIDDCKRGPDYQRCQDRLARRAVAKEQRRNFDFLKGRRGCHGVRPIVRVVLCSRNSSFFTIQGSGIRFDACAHREHPFIHRGKACGAINFACYPPMSAWPILLTAYGTGIASLQGHLPIDPLTAPLTGYHLFRCWPISFNVSPNPPLSC